METSGLTPPPPSHPHPPAVTGCSPAERAAAPGSRPWNASMRTIAGEGEAGFGVEGVSGEGGRG